MISILDYGVGNLRSVQKAFQRFNMDAEITFDKTKIKNSSHICLPGVGAFKKGMEGLVNADLIDVIENEIKKGKPFLGICLGMQLLFEDSEEDGYSKGLSILKGSVKKFDNGLKVPHMGWNDINIVKPYPLFKEVNSDKMYFVHSYYVQTEQNNVAATCDYGVKFAAAISCDNIFATQFHPEKCGVEGLKILKNFGGIK